MKKSELKNEIKNYVYEILSEEPVEEGTYVGKDAVDDLQRDPKFASAQDKVTPINTLKTGGSVTLQEEDDDSSPDDDAIDKQKENNSNFDIDNLYQDKVKFNAYGDTSTFWKNVAKDYETLFKMADDMDLDPDNSIEGRTLLHLNNSLRELIKSYTPPTDNKNLNESEEDSSPDDETIDKQAKAAAKKEKVNTPSKFKVPNSEFEDFKTRLKNLVKKIKDMEKGDEKDKKMAALKQFIKKPELVKAFKERDVQIDTDGLIGENKFRKR